ncbi:hypothetical protein AMATHDRAFT_55620 [Amanita thiersii Skay4041]|uniref:Uncharacterized protein n=1 Tax=Amanita thiersii Skay4041 TaxID=703135 RepID=A0A2A9NYU9_9AGAR|nr:hypothetical protein AMATHDRAFT_55620 [Amanita thiersii Skay4041]
MACCLFTNHFIISLSIQFIKAHPKRVSGLSCRAYLPLAPHSPPDGNGYSNVKRESMSGLVPGSLHPRIKSLIATPKQLHHRH